MYACCLCRFEAELDDVAVLRGTNGCVCVRCFARETGNEHPMPKALRRDVEAALAEVMTA